MMTIGVIESLELLTAGGVKWGSQTVSPFKLAATDKSLTAHGGLALFGEFFHAFGLCGLIDQELPAPGSAAGRSAGGS